MAATPKTAVSIIPGANHPVIITEISVSGSTTDAILVELMESTQAGAGTGTGHTVQQVRGYVAATLTAPVATCSINFSAEPTALTLLKQWRFTGPGPFVIQSPLGREVASLVSGASTRKALVVRLTSAATPTYYATVEFE